MLMKSEKSPPPAKMILHKNKEREWDSDRHRDRRKLLYEVTHVFYYYILLCGLYISARDDASIPSYIFICTQAIVGSAYWKCVYKYELSPTRESHITYARSLLCYAPLWL